MSQSDKAEWRSVLTPNMLSVLQVEPGRLSISGLVGIHRALAGKPAGFATVRSRALGKFFYPLATCVLVLLALPFAQIQQRAGGVGMRIFVGILLRPGVHRVQLAVFLSRCCTSGRHSSARCCLTDLPVCCDGDDLPAGAKVTATSDTANAEQINKKHLRVLFDLRESFAFSRRARYSAAAASGTMFAYMRFFLALDHELHRTGDRREQRVILAHADVDAWMDGGTTLAHDDGAGVDQFAAIGL